MLKLIFIKFFFEQKLNQLGFNYAAEMLDTNKSFMTILTNGIASTIFLITLHVTRAVDFKELT